MTIMEGRCSLGKSTALAARDGVLSRLAGAEWPFVPLLDLLDLPPTADLLDVGAGDGRLLRRLRTRSHVGRLLGLDPQPDGPGVVRGEASALPFAARSFDVVTLVRVVGHLPDARGALAEARRVGRPGGRVVLAAHGVDHLRETGRVLGRPAGLRGPKEALRDALVGAGWVALRLDARMPVTVTAADAGAWVLASGSQEDLPWTAFPVHDTLHLAAYETRF